ncbi:MAG: sugar ABC transporter permease [Anaerolineae bacterium]|nr:sugar ABC transporter permease [Anaerolineae bacterium]
MTTDRLVETSVNRKARTKRAKPAGESGYGYFLIPGITIFLFLIILPFLANIGLSFTKWQGIGTPEWIGLDNYRRAMGDSIFWMSFKNNLYLIIAMTIVPTIIGLLLAVVLFDYIHNRFGSKWSSFFRAGFYLPQIVPVVVAAIVWKWIYQPNWGALNWFLSSIGLENLTQNWLGDARLALPSVMVMLVWFQIGYPLVIFMSGLQRVDPQIYEAAKMDGANWFQTFLYITIHLIRPEIAVVVVTTMIAALKTFGPIYAMTSGGPGNATTVASYFAWKNFFERSNVGYGSTMATVLTLIVLVMTYFFIRVQQQRED